MDSCIVRVRTAVLLNETGLFSLRDHHVCLKNVVLRALVPRGYDECCVAWSDDSFKRSIV